MTRIAPVLAFLFVFTVLSAQDPPAPPGGFPIKEVLNIPVRYSDGYRTLADLRYPAVQPGPNGWPLILKVHGLGGSRRNSADQQRLFASWGYAVLAYDVRGQGDAKTLNPPTAGTTLIGLNEKIDMAEEIEAALRRFGSLLDGTRIAVMGGSQGGVHAWAAAAWSERKFPPNPRRSRPFPKILAVAAAAMTADPMVPLLHQGTAMHARVVDVLFDRPGLVLDPSFRRIGQQAFLQQAFQPLYQYLLNDPGRSNAAGLAQTRVATLVNVSYHDYWVTVNPTLDLLSKYPATTPWRLLLGTGGHGSPKNRYVQDYWLQLRRRWFDRFLKGIPNGVEREPRVVAFVSPVDPQRYLDLRSVWAMRYESAWGAGTTLRRWYLRAGGKLTTRAPSGTEPADAVRHQVAPGFGPAQFAPIALNVKALAQYIPLSSVAYTSPPLAADLALAGRARARLVVSPSTSTFMLQAALFAVDPQTGKEVYLAHAYGARREPAVPAKTALTLQFGGVETVVPAGARLRVRVENHTYRRPPGQKLLRLAPYFTATTIRVWHTAADPSFIDLPVRSVPPPALIPDRLRVSVSRPQRLGLRIEGGRFRAGRPYFVVASLAGMAPGWPLPGGTLPLNPDALTVVSLLLANTPLFPNTVGTLDGGGQAAPAVDFTQLGSLPPGLAGLRLVVAAWVHRSATDLTGVPTNPVEVFFGP